MQTMNKRIQGTLNLNSTFLVAIELRHFRKIAILEACLLSLLKLQYVLHANNLLSMQTYRYNTIYLGSQYIYFRVSNCQINVILLHKENQFSFCLVWGTRYPECLGLTPGSQGLFLVGFGGPHGELGITPGLAACGTNALSVCRPTSPVPRNTL